jgi:hypothetical protein
MSTRLHLHLVQNARTVHPSWTVKEQQKLFDPPEVVPPKMGWLVLTLVIPVMLVIALILDMAGA